MPNEHHESVERRSTAGVEGLRSWCVEDPKVGHVIDLASGEVLKTRDVIGTDYAALIRLRMRLSEAVAENKAIYICGMCHTPVYIVANGLQDGEQAFTFRHVLEDGRCPAKTRGRLSDAEIRMRLYNGVKESTAHKEMKALIAESLACDPDFSHINVESVWMGEDRVSRRKPDVRAVWRGTVPVAFEIQLTRALRRVIAERRVFYRKEEGLLCWVLKDVATEAPPLMQDDIFYNNNRNLFLASPETLAASRERRALMLDCRWTELQVAASGEGFTEMWRQEVVPFYGLTLDVAQQRVFYVDCDKARARRLAAAADAELRQRFEEWWTTGNYNTRVVGWAGFQRDFRERGITVPEWPTDSRLRSLLDAIYTAKTGRPIGFGHPKFISVAHTMASAHKDLLQPFRAALAAYERGAQLLAEDADKKWRKKVAAYTRAIKAKDPAYDQDRSLYPLVEFLFPEVWQKLRDFEAEEFDTPVA